MEGGLFGLSDSQKVFLYLSQLVPSLIILFLPDLIESMLLTQIFYILASYVYIRFMSI